MVAGTLGDAAFDALAVGLGATLAALFEIAEAPAAVASTSARVTGPTVWTNPASGYLRRNWRPRCSWWR